MDIVSRAEWEARPPKRTPTPIVTPTPELWLHHTAAADDPWHGPGGMRTIQNLHMDDRGWNDIAYSYVVDTDGVVYEARGTGVQGAHTKYHNSISHAICVMGNFETETPTEATLQTVADLARFGHGEGWWPATFTGGHKDVASTKCPGKNLYTKIATINQYALEDPVPESYTDVPPDHPFYEDVEWASAKGYIKGDLVKKLFYPDLPLTRVQAAAVLRRYDADQP